MTGNRILPVTFEEGFDPDALETHEKLDRLEQWLEDFKGELERTLAMLQAARGEAS